MCCKTGLDGTQVWLFKGCNKLHGHGDLEGWPHSQLPLLSWPSTRFAVNESSP